MSNILSLWKYIKNYKSRSLRQKLARQNWYAETYGSIDDTFVAISYSEIHYQDTNKIFDKVLQLHDFSVGSQCDTGLTVYSLNNWFMLYSGTIVARILRHFQECKLNISRILYVCAQAHIWFYRCIHFIFYILF